MKGQSGYDHLAKLLIIGDSGVGKTNILLRFCENNFMSSHLTTIGRPILTQELTSKSRQSKLMVSASACKYGIQQVNSALRQSPKHTTRYSSSKLGKHRETQGAMGIIMVYSVDDRNSFNSMENWLKQIKTHAAENVVKVLVANKVDR